MKLIANGSAVWVGQYCMYHLSPGRPSNPIRKEHNDWHQIVSCWHKKLSLVSNKNATWNKKWTVESNYVYLVCPSMDLVYYNFWSNFVWEGQDIQPMFYSFAKYFTCCLSSVCVCVYANFNFFFCPGTIKNSTPCNFIFATFYHSKEVCMLNCHYQISH